MALLFMDGFDHYTSVLLKWNDTFNNGGCGTSIGAYGRYATGGVHHFQNIPAGAGGGIKKNVTVGSTTAIIGFAFRKNGSNIGGNCMILSILDSATTQMALYLNTDGTLSVARNTTVLETTTATIVPDVYHYIEFKTEIHPSAGTWELRMDNTNISDGSATDTQQTANTSWSGIYIGNISGSPGAGHTWDYDDLYICDSTGAVNNNFLGPVRIKTIYPDSAGASTDFTPLSGSNFQMVDETAQDGDTTYNSETTPGDHDTYNFGALGVTGVVKGVQTNLVVRSDGTGTETIRPKIRISGADYNGTTVGVSTGYLDKWQMFNVSPATSTTWTISEIDGTEFGIELVS